MAPAETPRVEQPVADPAVLDFSARWLELPESVDLQAGKIDGPRSSYAAEQAAPVYQPPMASSTWFVAADVKDVVPRAGLANFASVFLASALGIIGAILVNRLLKLTRWCYQTLGWPRPRTSELGDRPQEGLVELKEILRRVDEAVQWPRSFTSSSGEVAKMLADRRVPRLVDRI